MARRRLIVLGTSGLARETALVAEQVNLAQGLWSSIDFVGESQVDRGRDLGFGRVLGDDEWLLGQDFEADLVIGIGYPRVRARVASRYLPLEGRFSFPNLVHPTAMLDRRRVVMGHGNIVTAGCVFTCDIEVGHFNYFNLCTTVGHDTRVGSCCVFNPSVNVSGGVHVGDRVLAGTGSRVLENLTVGSDATVGAGAVVTRDVAPGTTVVGIPAKARPQHPS